MLSICGMNSELTIRALASESAMTKAISRGLSSELIGPASAPSLKHAKYAMMYSAPFGISRPTLSPFPMPFAASSRTVRFTAASNSEYVKLRPSASEKRKSFSGVASVRRSRSSRRFAGSAVRLSVAVFSLRLITAYDILIGARSTKCLEFKL